jgi:hypothetical protein
MDAKIKALAQHLDIDLTEEEIDDSDAPLFIIGRAEYLVLTDDEADKRAADEIAESVWAFRPEFLSAHSDADQEVFEALQATGKCESLNGPVRSLIRDWDHFVSDAIAADGRGHFISSYDGEENEVSIGGKWFFVYRVQ